MNQAYTEKEILGDALSTAKATTGHFDTFSNECVHENVRNTMLNILADEHDIQDDIFHMMSDRGYYPTPEADTKKVESAKQKYQASYKVV